MPANPKFIKLLESVKDATTEGRIDWSEMFGREYRTQFDELSLRTGFDIGDKQDNSYYYVYLFDKTGDLLEALTSEDDEGTYLSLIRELLESAKRRARKVDDLLDNLTKKLDARRSASTS